MRIQLLGVCADKFCFNITSTESIKLAKERRQQEKGASRIRQQRTREKAFFDGAIEKGRRIRKHY